ncbi:MAG: sigma 54-interacting transcriptional regulator [Woeseiaceae bacterium]
MGQGELTGKKALCLDGKFPAQTSDFVRWLANDGWKVDCVGDASTAHRRIKQFRYPIGIATLCEDFITPELEKVFTQSPEMKWIALVSKNFLQTSGASTIVKDYFHDYHTMPVDTQRLSVTLGHARGMVALRSARADQENANRFGIVAKSAAMQAFLHRLNKVALADTDVLISGETGTGKELVARAIHGLSLRRGGPFVAVNCAALPANLFHSELFGHERGAFTGALARRVGKLEMAARGFVFLDEIAELSLEQQASLLRFLGERAFIRLGGTKNRLADVRVISATHRKLDSRVAEGSFREDLFYRIDTVRLQVPALRERHGDIDLLAQHFLGQANRRRQGTKKRGFTAEALRLLNAYQWPGNVRELMNVVQRAAVLGTGRYIGAGDLHLQSARSRQRPLSLNEAREKAERRAIGDAVSNARGNLSRAAKDLGVSRVTLYRLMKKYRPDLPVPA